MSVGSSARGESLLFLGEPCTPLGDAAGERIPERGGLPAGSESAQVCDVGAPSGWIAGSRGSSTTNLFRGRDERAQLSGEIDDARRLPTCDVDDAIARALIVARAVGES